jgi:hypothetical protein
MGNLVFRVIFCEEWPEPWAPSAPGDSERGATSAKTKDGRGRIMAPKQN